MSALLILVGVGGALVAWHSIPAPRAPFDAATVRSADLLGEWSHLDSPERSAHLELSGDGSFTIDALPSAVFEWKPMNDGDDATIWADATHDIAGSWTRTEDGYLQLTWEGRSIVVKVLQQDGEYRLFTPLPVEGDEWGVAHFSFTRSGEPIDYRG